MSLANFRRYEVLPAAKSTQFLANTMRQVVENTKSDARLISKLSSVELYQYVTKDCILYKYHLKEVLSMASQSKSAVDIHVGRRLYAARLVKGLSQSALGSALGLTFQQIQKYEAGANRVSAERLHQITEALEVPFAYFFEGLEKSSKGFEPNAQMAAIASALSTAEGIRIAIALSAIENSALRRGIAALLEGIVAKKNQTRTAISRRSRD